ncbi:putative ABC transport system permease protein [Peptoniphilus olsenii]|uniref:ABC transport system permease protein n=1 Tax=Peptoniphilus olsenii TaxID=411570 RepID=A0ABV2JAG7_9FIRM
MNVVELQIGQFLLIYLLLLIVLFIMKRYKVDHTKLLITASVKMTVQLIIAGLILTYIFKNPHPAFTIAYLVAMTLFTIHRVLSKNKDLNKNFKKVIAISISISGLFVIMYFVYLVVGESIFNPQYVIPISGMIMGNVMTGVSLGIKTFKESLVGKRAKVDALLSVGAAPDRILLPFVKQAFETAFLPTLNSMIGMGIVSLPGMMTGQILAGTLPNTAIMYQIAIMIAISTAVTCASFGSLFFGYKTLFDKDTQII